MKKYQIIYADPPWKYNDQMKGHQGAETHYKTQSLEWIKSLRVEDISDKSCVLFLWIVSPLLVEGLEVIKAWKFKYKTIAFCWNKVYPNGKLVSNLDRWTMGNIELCLLGTKGNPKRITKNVKQQMFSIRKSHSEKPNEARKRIVKLMGDLPRIELFAREKKERNLLNKNIFDDWDVWGNEVKSDIDLMDLIKEIR